MPLQKTRRKRKIKIKTQKKKRRSKKGGNPRQVALNVFNFLTKKIKRISEGKDNYDDHAAAAQARAARRHDHRAAARRVDGRVDPGKPRLVP